MQKKKEEEKPSDMLQHCLHFQIIIQECPKWKTDEKGSTVGYIRDHNRMLLPGPAPLV